MGFQIVNQRPHVHIYNSKEPHFRKKNYFMLTWWKVSEGNNFPPDFFLFIWEKTKYYAFSDISVLRKKFLKFLNILIIVYFLHIKQYWQESCFMNFNLNIERWKIKRMYFQTISCGGRGNHPPPSIPLF